MPAKHSSILAEDWTLQVKTPSGWEFVRGLGVVKVSITGEALVVEGTGIYASSTSVGCPGQDLLRDKARRCGIENIAEIRVYSKIDPEDSYQSPVLVKWTTDVSKGPKLPRFEFSLNGYASKFNPIESSLRGVSLTREEADSVSNMAPARASTDARAPRSINVSPTATASEISEALKSLDSVEKAGQREALDAVYAAIVRTANIAGLAQDFDFGDELTGLAALLHELKQ